MRGFGMVEVIILMMAMMRTTMAMAPMTIMKLMKIALRTDIA